jgi:hypothetical protein
MEGRMSYGHKNLWPGEKSTYKQQVHPAEVKSRFFLTFSKNCL